MIAGLPNIGISTILIGVEKQSFATSRPLEQTK